MNLLDLILFLFLFSGFIQLFYYCFFFSRLAFFKQKNNTFKSEAVSVIISARNEEDNLLKNLPLILKQNYENFEVVVINDCSVDDTTDILNAFNQKYDHLKVVTVKETKTFFGGKKFALTLGIKAAKNENLLFTDADCKPSSKNWLRNVTQHLSADAEIILGYGKYAPKKGLLNLLIRFDTFYVALQYFSFSIAGTPYMGVGRNLAYKKSLFFKNKGFASHQNISSGDDDLFINEVSHKNNTDIVICKDSFTISEPKLTFKDWFFQKKRHLTTGGNYKLKHQLLLGFLFISQLLFFTLFIVLIVLQYQWELVLAMFVLRLLIQNIIFYKSMGKLEEKGLIGYVFILEILLMLVYPIFAISTIFHKQTTWTR